MFNNLTTNTGHIIIAVCAIAAAVILGVQRIITSGEVIGLIAGAGGFSMGASAANSPSVPVTITGTTTTTTAATSTAPALP
jgi:hypothetical protein